MPVSTLSLKTSSPTSSRKTVSSSIFVPIELENGCSEEGCVIDSDDANLTNIIRKHYLEHFGHRDLDAIVSDYSPTAYMVHVVNGERTKYRGHEEIRQAFGKIFAQHPTTDSSFHLKSITVEAKHAHAVWQAQTPTDAFPQSTDTFVFDDAGKIIKQFFSCQINHKDVPWYVEGK